MDGNKDESMRSLRIAESAIASGDKQRALKFIKIAKRLNSEASVEDLYVACEKLGLEEEDSKGDVNVNLNVKHSDPSSKASEPSGSSYSEEHVRLIRQVERNKDYYAVLGVERSCSVEEIRKAYRKLSLKVHPDKNKAPGSEEAFNKVCQAFKCLSEENSRREYNQTESVEDFEYAQQQNVRRRKRAGNDYFHDDFDANDIFTRFFDRRDAFGDHAQRARGMARQQQSRQRESNHGEFSMMVLLQLAVILVVFFLAVVPFSEPEFSLQKTSVHRFQYSTEKHGVEFYVKSSDFDNKHPAESPSRVDIEDQVVREYKNILGHYCRAEIQRRQWNRNYRTPHCDKLRNLGTA